MKMTPMLIAAHFPQEQVKVSEACVCWRVLSLVKLASQPCPFLMLASHNGYEKDTDFAMLWTPAKEQVSLSNQRHVASVYLVEK